MGRRVHNAQPGADPTATPDLRLKSYPEELKFRLRRWLRGDAFLLLFLLLAMVMARSTDQVLFYRMARKYKNYIWYLSTVVLPIAYLCITWPVTWYRMYVSKVITPEMRHWKYHLVYAGGGAMDTLFNLTSSWPVPYLSGPITNTLSNAVLPFTMVASILVLKTKYKFTHYIGATLVMYGIMIQLLPQLFLGEDANASHHHTNHQHGHAAGADDSTHEQKQGVWIVVLILSAIPAAISNIVKEGGLKGADLDEWLMNSWVSTYQLAFGLMTFPTVAIPFPKPAPVISFSELPEYCGNAHKCFFGTNSTEGDDCHGMFFIFMIFIIFNISYNQLSLVIFKRGSSVLFTIASAMRLPVVDFLLLSSFIAGPASVDKLTVYTYYAVFALILGIATYYHEKEVHAIRPDPQTDKDFVEAFPIIHSPHVGQGKMRPVPPPDLEGGAEALDEPLLADEHGAGGGAAGSRYGSYDGPSLEL